MYKYEEIKPEIFKEENQKDFLKTRDEVDRLIEIAGAFRLEKAIKDISGSSWLATSYIDRLIELGEIEEIKTDGWIQHRIFIRKY